MIPVVNDVIHVARNTICVVYNSGNLVLSGTVVEFIRFSF